MQDFTKLSLKELIALSDKSHARVATNLIAANNSIEWENCVDAESIRKEADKYSTLLKEKCQFTENEQAVLDVLRTHDSDDGFELGCKDTIMAYNNALYGISNVKSKFNNLFNDIRKKDGLAKIKNLNDASTPQEIADVYYTSAYGWANTNMMVTKICDAIQNKDSGMLLVILKNSANKASMLIFEKITKIKLAKTKKARMVQIDEFCGITPTMRAEIIAAQDKAYADNLAKREIEDFNCNCCSYWSGAKNKYVTIDNKTITLTAALLQYHADGFECVSYKRGCITKYSLKREHVLISLPKMEIFNNIVKSAIKCGGFSEFLKIVAV